MIRELRFVAAEMLLAWAMAVIPDGQEAGVLGLCLKGYWQFVIDQRLNKFLTTPRSKSEDVIPVRKSAKEERT